MKRLAVIGTTLLDHVIYPQNNLENGRCNKIIDYLAGGGAMFNIASQLGMLEQDVVFYTKLGNDQWAQMLRDQLKSNGVDVVSVDIDKATPIFTLIAQQPPLMTCSITDKFHFSECPVNFNNKYEYLITDQASIALWETFEKTESKNIIAIGFVPERRFWLAIHSIIINEHEFYDQFGNQDYLPLHNELEQLGIPLIITKGESGIEMFGSHKMLLPAVESEANFYLGCGDAFTVGWIYGVVYGLSVEKSAICGLQAAAWCLSSPIAITEEIKNLNLIIHRL